ncbi:hypothetical protein, partial [Amycolatopsis sp. NPDC004625]|uniref:hypothetical protein n=1 Tax=Amycolatopsis sp. NPDC004625 TaxID=3154670 RepID=UPI0033AFC75C
MLRQRIGVLAMLVPLCLTGVTAAAAAPRESEGPLDPAFSAGSAAGELVTTTRLADRRSLVTGPGAYVLGDESGLYP